MGFADLESRQRRKSFVGSDPLPISLTEWLLFSGGLGVLPRDAAVARSPSSTGVPRWSGPRNTLGSVASPEFVRSGFSLQRWTYFGGSISTLW